MRHLHVRREDNAYDVVNDTTLNNLIVGIVSGSSTVLPKGDGSCRGATRSGEKVGRTGGPSVDASTPDRLSALCGGRPNSMT